MKPQQQKILAQLGKEKENEIKKATEAALIKKKEWELQKKQAEKNSGILIRYCGGCGYSLSTGKLYSVSTRVTLPPANCTFLTIKFWSTFNTCDNNI